MDIRRHAISSIRTGVVMLKMFVDLITLFFHLGGRHEELHYVITLKHWTLSSQYSNYACLWFQAVRQDFGFWWLHQIITPKFLQPQLFKLSNLEHISALSWNINYVLHVLVWPLVTIDRQTDNINNKYKRNKMKCNYLLFLNERDINHNYIVTSGNSKEGDDFIPTSNYNTNVVGWLYCM